MDLLTIPSGKDYGLRSGVRAEVYDEICAELRAAVYEEMRAEARAEVEAESGQ
jgi:hypothetical protein